MLVQQVVEWERHLRSSTTARSVRAASRGLVALGRPASGLAQVVATLLENALVHGGGTIPCRTADRAGSVVVEVRDEGPGVPAELVPHIFERDVSGAHAPGSGLAVARDARPRPTAAGWS